MTIRLALVGLGKIARDQHLPAIAATAGVELAAIVSRNATLAGVPCFPTIEAMLAAGVGVDAVSLCTPPPPRRAQAAAALEAGLHVMLEKPPGATVAEIGTLSELAQARRRTLFATWHSRHAAGVEATRALLAGRSLSGVEVVWKEDVRHWHPGQEWIFAAGGLGVFDPGINALSILTRVLPRRLFVTEARLEFPANRQAPIAASVAMSDTTGMTVRMALDFLQTGPQSWDMRFATDGGEVVLSGGGRRLEVDGRVVAEGPDQEYAELYQRFAALVTAGESEVDVAPLQLVADAFLLGERVSVDAFSF